jgi:PAS domain S-box-containing protein
VVSATIGVTTLCVATVQPWDRYAVLWSDWWLGDALGALVVAPALLTIIRTPWTMRDAVRAAVFVAGTIGITQLAFGRPLGDGVDPLEYVVFPVVIAAALAGGTRPTCLVVLGASIVSIWNTAGGAGPFARPDLHHTLILVQAFTGVLAASGLLLGAAIAERIDTVRREEEALAVLRHREEMLRLAQRAGGVATFEWDFHRQRAECSPEFFRMFGLPEDTDVITSEDWGRFVHPDDRERMSEHLARVLADAEPATADYRIVLADGSVRWLSYTGRLQQTADGPRLLGSVVEITARKETEQALERAKNEAESASRLKDEFLATLSHELRTPLNAVLGYTQMLRSGAVLPERQIHAVDVIERNATLQHQLIEDLLDMSRLTTGKLRVDPAPMSLDAVLADALDVVRPAADARRISLDVQVTPEAGTMIGDATRLQQVFWNVLANALKFTPSGGVVTVMLRRDAGHAEIEVRDTGIGIDPAFLPFVFDPFRQAQDGAARSESGLGLGLAISRQLVELHGGTITVSSPGLGQGATVVVRLPLRRA